MKKYLLFLFILIGLQSKSQQSIVEFAPFLFGGQYVGIRALFKNMPAITSFSLRCDYDTTIWEYIDTKFNDTLVGSGGQFGQIGFVMASGNNCLNWGWFSNGGVTPIYITYPFITVLREKRHECDSLIWSDIPAYVEFTDKNWQVFHPIHKDALLCPRY